LSPELPLHYVYQEEEAPADLLHDQERNSGLHQKDPDHRQIKEEQEDLCTSLNQEDPEPPQMKEDQEELCTSLDQEDPELPQMKEEQEELCTSLDQEDPELPQIKEEQEELCTSVDQEDPESPQMKEEQEELCTSVDQENSESSQIKEEQEELCTSLEGQLLVQNQESDTFIATPTYKERDHSDTEPNSYQLLCHNYFVAERSDQERSKHADLEPTTNAKLKQTKTHHRNSSHSHNIDNTPMAESHCETDTGKKTLTCEVCGKAFKNRHSLKKHYSSHTDEKLFACKACEKSFRDRAHLKVHMRTHTGEKPYNSHR
ncbi:zinc finger protein 37-like, partial [Stegastes partitus]|uniref:Zinc finger protein 37-like n=1 Tax=Stegastes partitus TaxID=144197 RepID=A0A9Y4NRT7_9TELE